MKEYKRNRNIWREKNRTLLQHKKREKCTLSDLVFNFIHEGERSKSKSCKMSKAMLSYQRWLMLESWTLDPGIAARDVKSKYFSMLSHSQTQENKIRSRSGFKPVNSGPQSTHWMWSRFKPVTSAPQSTYWIWSRFKPVNSGPQSTHWIWNGEMWYHWYKSHP